MWVAVREEAAAREVPSPERLSRVSRSFNVRLWSSGLHLPLKYMDYATKPQLRFGGFSCTRIFISLGDSAFLLKGRSVLSTGECVGFAG